MTTSGSFDETFLAYQEFRKFRELYQTSQSKSEAEQQDVEDEEEDADKENCQSFANKKTGAGQKVPLSEKKSFLKVSQPVSIECTPEPKRKPKEEKRASPAPAKDKTQKSTKVLSDEQKAPKPFLSNDNWESAADKISLRVAKPVPAPVKEVLSKIVFTRESFSCLKQTLNDMNPNFRQNLIKYLKLFVKAKGPVDFEAEIKFIQEETENLQDIFSAQLEKIQSLEKDNSKLENQIVWKSQENSEQNLNETDLISESYEEFCLVPVPRKFSAWQENKSGGQKIKAKNGSFKSNKSHKSGLKVTFSGQKIENDQRVSSNLQDEKSDFESPFPSENKSAKPAILEAPAREKFIKFDEQEKVKTSDFIASLSPTSDKAEVTEKMPLSQKAQEFDGKLKAALSAGDHLELTNLIFDAECEELESELDLNMYQAEAQKLMSTQIEQ